MASTGLSLIWLQKPSYFSTEVSDILIESVQSLAAIANCDCKPESRKIKMMQKFHNQTKVSFRTFFEKATIHPNAHLIKGIVCGYRIEEIEHEFEVYKQCRRLEKLIDELAKGRKMEKILRK